MTVLPYAEITALDPDDAHAMVEELPTPENLAGDVRWTLAHGRVGITWARWDPAGWTTAHDAFPEAAPPIRAELVDQIRFFGPDLDILIWRDPEPNATSFRGRRFVPTAQAPADDPLAPMRETHILAGNHVEREARKGFTWLSEGRGIRHVVPVEVAPSLPTLAQWPVRLLVEHHLEERPDTGTVRIAATRLVDVILKEAQS